MASEPDAACAVCGGACEADSELAESLLDEEHAASTLAMTMTYTDKGFGFRISNDADEKHSHPNG